MLQYVWSGYPLRGWKPAAFVLFAAKPVFRNGRGIRPIRRAMIDA